MGRGKGKSPYDIMTTSSGPQPKLRRDRPRFGGSSFQWGKLLNLRQWATSIVRSLGFGQRLKSAASQPVQLAIPRGLLAVVGLLLVVVVATAFIAGRGTTPPIQGTALNPNDPANTPDDAFQSGDPTVVAYAGASTQPDQPPDDAEPGGARRIAIPTADTREPGLNYLAVVTTVPDEARRIQRYFADHGVATILTSPNNKGLVQVIDISRGFTREEYRSGEQADHRTSRLAIGRAWKQHNHGIGDNLSKMYFSKYTPKD